MPKEIYYERFARVEFLFDTYTSTWFHDSDHMPILAGRTETQTGGSGLKVYNWHTCSLDTAGKALIWVGCMCTEMDVDRMAWFPDQNEATPARRIYELRGRTTKPNGRRSLDLIVRLFEHQHVVTLAEQYESLSKKITEENKELVEISTKLNRLRKP